MDFQYLGNSSPSVLIVKDFFNDDELKLIWEELDFLTKRNTLLSYDKTGSATDGNAQMVKRNHGIFLDTVYNYRAASNILTLNSKIFGHGDEFSKHDPIFRHVKNSTVDTTLLSYYEDGDSYGTHTDQSNLTILTWFYKEPKMFTGGQFVLDDFGIEIEVENNMLMIIPGSYRHSVIPVKMEDKTPYSGMGRYCVSHFLSYS